MSKTLLIVLLAALCPLQAWAQTISYVRVNGHVTDKDTHQPLENATVALLYAKDSSRVAIAFTDKNGAFILNARPGMYHLYITYLGYQQQLKPITLAADTLTDAGAIFLQKTGVTLGMVEIVEIRAPMVVKKDTLEFNADYYKTRENAMMEELLKKLPGLEIDKDGVLKINGTPVKRILIDGQPFFGDNPKLAIRNLPADMIDKVQLIDRKSDQAQFSGALDSQPEKTINITVKKAKKEKLIGHLTAGYGTRNRFSASTSLNRFGQQSLSLLGSGHNEKGALENGTLIGDAGLSRALNGGGNFSQTINKALKISGSYFLIDYSQTTESTSARQNLLPDTTYYYNQHTNESSHSINHMSGIQMQYNPDSMHTLVFSINATYMKTRNTRENGYESLGDQQQLVNRGTIHNLNHTSIPGINGSVLWGKRFKKPGRTLSVNIAAGYNTNKQQQFNRSDNLFIQPNGEELRDTINQRNNLQTPHRVFSINLTWTEPLYKDHFLDVVYTYNRDRSSAEKLTYDYNAVKEVYDQLNDSLSNSFRSTAQLQLARLAFRAQKANYEYSIGVQMQASSLSNNNISEHSRLQKSITGFFPIAVFSYAFNSNRRLRFQYTGNMQQPDLTLLQPVPNNNNPLYIQLGNPDLKPTVTHNAGIVYNAVNPAALHSTMLTVNASLTRNKVIIASRLDSLGRQVSRPLNANGAYALNMSMANGFPLKKMQANINMNTSLALNHDINSINGQMGNVNNITANQDLSCNYTYKQLLDCTLGAGVNYNGARYTHQEQNNIHVFNYTLFFNYNLVLPLGFNIGGNINYLHNTGIAAGQGVDVTMVNAFIAKNILQHNRGQFKLQGCDLLNRNQGYARVFEPNYVEDVRTNILERFFILSFTWFFK
ncbi:Outer membrane receptor proteins, mostly Fe transport [Chitinophaga rupis]|uniref:Outer membrane receptor proteins, mostly Fe transport n=1 Tax=Chitinophaga rupis TaxID=573321 RepID=A0A1H7RUV8_9BACT|nr:outer membrane beta-barrel protein [Chitinophaga rupis]SEL64033.1 Outer membrane receptor proteins, mostly Fe transport [Chitinophaga rupis]